MNAQAHIKALDLFAGTGWGVACKRLGIKEAGVEIMPEAVQTRTANGMETIYNDVWDGLQLTAEQHRQAYGSYGLLIASPPCQTFSMAGNGKGREALNEVIEAIELHAYKDADALHAFGEKHDPRTALVLTPLAYVWRDRPRLVAMEQVPTVLPVWEACAEVMREWGYDVKVEVLSAEQYGVPQTRKRAILVARRGGPVHMPIPTHSRYYSRTPHKLDTGVQKWVSMAEALGWGWSEGPSWTLMTARGRQTGHDVLRGSSWREGKIRELVTSPEWVSPTDGRACVGSIPLEVDEAAALQSYPNGVKFTQNNKLANQSVRPLTHPAPTVTAGHDSGNRGFITDEGFTIASPVEVAALQSYPVTFRNGNQANASRRTEDQPAPTIAFGNNAGRVEWVAQEETVRVTVDEAGTLQTYEKPFVWCGSKSKQFLQIGNAVPPVLAEAVLTALIGTRPGR